MSLLKVILLPIFKSTNVSKMAVNSKNEMCQVENMHKSSKAVVKCTNIMKSSISTAV